jgi:hypothetical protein
VTIQTFQLAAPNSSSNSNKKLLPALQMQKIKVEPGSSKSALPQTIKLEPGVTQPLPPHAHQPLKLEIQETFLDTGELNFVQINF